MFAIAPTDHNWFNYLKNNQITNSVNFWTPTPWNVKRLKSGDRFYFMLKHPIRKLGGYGKFRLYEEVNEFEAWKKYGYGNGCENFDYMKSRLFKYREKHDAKSYKNIGCIILDDIVCWNPKDYKIVDDYKISFPIQVVKIKYFDQHDPFMDHLNKRVNWSDFELKESMKAYLWMLEKHQNGESYTKTKVYKTLAENNLKDRTLKSIEYRMENISHVLKENGYDWIEGITPAKNVGEKNTIRLLAYYKELTNKSDKFIPSIPEESEKEIHIRKNAAITGKEAEDEFESWAKNQGWSVVNKSDSHGIGYDFECITNEDEKIFVEVKGCRENIDSIRMTEREWQVAKQKGEHYRLIIISNLNYDEIVINEFSNPYKQFNGKISEPQITLSITYHLNKKHLIETLG